MGRFLALALLVAALCGCRQFVQYTDELTDARSGRSSFVTTPAALGGSAGFLVGIPAVIGALPVTYGVFAYQRSADPLGADAVSTLLFPSFVCWRVGKLLGSPFDFLEFASYRAWRSPETLTREERAEIEFNHDEKTLPSYPVRPIYPTEEWRDRADPGVGGR